MSYKETGIMHHARKKKLCYSIEKNLIKYKFRNKNQM